MWYTVDTWASKGLLHPYFGDQVYTTMVPGAFGSGRKSQTSKPGSVQCRFEVRISEDAHNPNTPSRYIAPTLRLIA